MNTNSNTDTADRSNTVMTSVITNDSVVDVQAADCTNATVTQTTAQKSKHKQPPLTHFVSVPIVSDQLNDIYTHQFLNKYDNIDPSMYVDTRSMHLTLLVLSLPTQQDIDRAAAVFNECTPQLKQFAQTYRHQLQFHGVKSFQTNLNKCRVIYAEPVQNNGVNALNEMLHIIANKMHDNDIITTKTLRNMYSSTDSNTDLSQYTSDMLHVQHHLTLINSKYKRQKKRYGTVTYDGTTILEQHADTHFGAVPITEIQLCKMQRDKTTMKYQIVTNVQLND